MQIAVIVPCLVDEEKFPFCEFFEFISENEFIFYFINYTNDNEIFETLKNLEDFFPNKVAIIHINKKIGKLESIRLGVNLVVENKKYDIVGYICSSSSASLKEINILTKVFDNNEQIEVIFGSRISTIGTFIERGFLEHILERFTSIFIDLHLSTNVYDSACDLKFFRVKIASKIFYKKFQTNYLYNVEIFKRIKDLRGKIEYCSIEIPIKIWKKKETNIQSFLKLFFLPFEYCQLIFFYKKTS